MGRRFFPVALEMLTGRDATGNQMISDIHVKSFLTRGFGMMEGAYRVGFEEIFFYPEGRFSNRPYKEFYDWGGPEGGMMV